MHTNNEKFKGTSVTQKEKYFNSNLIKNIRKSETYIKNGQLMTQISKVSDF